MSDSNHKKELSSQEDPVGEETLEAFADADKFNEWMYEVVSSYLRGKQFIEVGSGIGNLSRFVIDSPRKSLFCSDLRTHYCEKLRKRFGSSDSFLGAAPLDLVAPDFESLAAEHLGKYDSLFTLNVVEHIEDDLTALSNAKKLVKKGGAVIVLVPAYQWLFNGFDEELGHYRRYTRTRLLKLFSDAGIKPFASQYFNAVGTAGWFLNGHILRKRQLPADQVKAYNLIVPIARFADVIMMKQFGLSVIVAGEVS